MSSRLSLLWGFYIEDDPAPSGFVVVGVWSRCPPDRLSSYFYQTYSCRLQEISENRVWHPKALNNFWEDTWLCRPLKKVVNGQKTEFII